MFNLIILALSLPAAEASKPHFVKAPNGPGSFKGLVAKGQVAGTTGAFSVSAPLSLPTWAGGLDSGLTLKYNSSFGHGPVGVGWSLGLPRIMRSHDHLGQPRFRLEGPVSGLLLEVADGYRIEGHGETLRLLREGQSWRLQRSDGSSMVFGAQPNKAAWFVLQLR